MGRVVGVGAGGHAKVAVDAVHARREHEVVALVDVDERHWGKRVLGVPVVGGDDRLAGLLEDGVSLAFVGVGSVGDARLRRTLFESLLNQGFRLLTIVHPAAVVASSASVGSGAMCFAGSVVNADAHVGANVIVNTGAIVEHDCVVDDHVHIATGARLAGGVRIEKGAHVGIGASVREGVRIGRDAVIAAGAVVVEDVPAGAVVAGVPARPMEGRRRG